MLKIKEVEHRKSPNYITIIIALLSVMLSEPFLLLFVSFRPNIVYFVNKLTNICKH